MVSLQRLSELFREVPAHPKVAGWTGLAGLLISIVALVLEEPVTGAILLAAILLAGAGFALYGIVIRDRTGGLLEVAREEHVWELTTPDGSEATLKRQREGRFLQKGIFSVREFVWSDQGRYENPRCVRPTKWKVVHEYETGERITALIAMEEVKNRGDHLDYALEWDVKDLFVDLENFVETELVHETKMLVIRVIFPSSRPPSKAAYIAPGSNPGDRTELPITETDEGLWEVSKMVWLPTKGSRYQVRWEWASPI